VAFKTAQLTYRRHYRGFLEPSVNLKGTGELRDMKRVSKSLAVKTSAGTLLAMALALSGISSIASAQTTTTVDRWGSFIGSSAGGSIDEGTSASPVAITLPGTVAQVASSNSTDYILLTNGTVYALGIGDRGELGDGRTSNNYATPVKVDFPAGVSIAHLADTSPFDTALAIDTKGSAWGWGYDSYGQLCQGNADEYLKPVQVPIAGTITALAGAGDHALYVANGNVLACGNNNHGDLGDNSSKASTTPVAVKGYGLQKGDVAGVYASWSNSAALLNDGSLDTWGYNAVGEVGNGHLGVDALVPQRIAFSSPVTEVSLGGSGRRNGQTLVMLQNETLWAWGDDRNAQLGDDATVNQASPIALIPPAGTTYSYLDTGGSTSYAIDSNGKVWAWGNNSAGEIGNGIEAKVSQKTPVMVESGASTISTTANNVITLSI
jgi:alpha-tubulin suppressor-like RCC1 family protein